MQFERGKMEKRVFFLLIIMTLALFISCSNSPASKNSSGNISSISDVLHDMSSFSYMSANIDSTTTAIGTQNEAYRSLSPGKFLVKQDGENGVIAPVEFKVVRTIDKNGNTVSGVNGKKLNFGDIFTQDMIKGKLDKVYVYDNYTFVSYVTIDVDLLFENSVHDVSDSSKYHHGYVLGDDAKAFEQINWNWNEDEDFIRVNYTTGNYTYSYDEIIYYKPSRYYEPAYKENDGVSKYDTLDYHTNMFRESFIIDNDTGYIYPIPNGFNISIHNGVPIDDEKGPLELSVNSDFSLSLTKLILNSDIKISDVYKDKYDHYYVCNDYFDTQDGNIIYYTNKNSPYNLTKQGESLYIEKKNNGYSISKIYVIDKDFKKREATSSDNFDFCGSSFHRLKDGKYYYYSSYGYGNLSYHVVDINTYITYTMNVHDSISATYYYPIDELHFVKMDKQGLFIGTIDADITNNDKWSEIYDSEGNSLNDSGSNIYEKSVTYGNSLGIYTVKENSVYKTALDLTFIDKSMSGTTTYKLSKNKLTEEYEMVELEKYVAVAQSISLQPINR